MKKEKKNKGITQHKQIEKSLLEKQEFFSVVEEIAKIGNYEWDVPKNEVIWTEGQCRIYGIKPEDFDGKIETVMGFMHPDDMEHVNEEIGKMIATKQPHLFEHRIIRPDGEVRLIHGNNKFYYDAEGNLTKIIGTNIDITDRRRAEEELRKHREHLEELVEVRTKELRKEIEERKEAEKAAEAANRAKSAFLANMSHELRTPLNAILGFSEMLEHDHSATTDQQEKLTIINRSGEHLLGMINDVLDLSKIEAGRVKLEQSVFDLPRMLEDMGRMFEVRAESTGLRFKLELDPALVHYIKTDVGKLRQILINLMGNAVKFTEQGGFTLYAQSKTIADDPTILTLQMEVEDSGPGIVAERIERIFEPFVQAGRSPGSTEGTGLGLAITKSFVELMGGVISVESKPGEGSLFRVELPVTLSDASESGVIDAAKPAVLGLELGQSEWRILVVEDNIENRLLLSSLLLQADFEIREAVNGEEAVNLFEQWQPHFIWMDMRMPVLDGYEATAKIRSLPGGDEVKIVALTASAFKEQSQSIIDAGCDHVVYKPFKSHEIFDTMAEQLGVRYIYEEEKKAAICRCSVIR